MLLILVNLAGVAFLLANEVDKNPPQKAKVDLGTISGKSFLIIQAAMPELKKQNLKPDKYQISVSEEDGSYYVLFLDPLRPVDTRKIMPDGRIQATQYFGSSGRFPEFDVEIDKASMKVIRLAFER